MPKIPFKLFKKKIFHNGEELHQRSVVGSIVFASKKVPERNDVDIAAEVNALAAAYRKKYDINTETINRGFCKDFAQDLHKKVGGAVIGDEDTGMHWWLIWKGKYYDAQTPEGVRQLENLPIYIYNRKFKLARWSELWNELQKKKK